MAGNGFLRTVNFGGFDKKDVLAYVDELNTKIYKLESELKEKNALIEGGGLVSSEGSEANEELLAALDNEKSKNSELMAAVDTLKLQVSNAESELAVKDEEIAKCKAEIEELNDKLSSAESGVTSSEPSFDIGSVFIEAKNAADRIVSEAKKAASKMNSDANELATQVIDDANIQAEGIIRSAKSESEHMLDNAKNESSLMIENARSESNSMVANAREEAETLAADAKAKADEMTKLAADVQTSALDKFNALEENIGRLQLVLSDIYSDSAQKISEAKSIISEGQSVASN